jgi:hypothetical protein
MPVRVSAEDMSHALLVMKSDASRRYSLLSSTSTMATLSDESATSLSSKLRKLLNTFTKLTSNSNTLDPEVDSLLQSNDLPPPQKRDEIASILHEHAFFVSEAEDTLADLTAFTKKVKEMNEQMAKKVDRYRIVLHPIRSLHPECLARIFEACVSEGVGNWEEYFSGPQLVTSQEKPLQRPSDGDPWTLSKICTQWRKVTMDNPRLWSNIALFVPEKSAFGTDSPRLGPSSLLNLQLARSKDIPLSIAIHGFGAKTSIPVLQGIMFQSYRWKSLYMDIPYPTLEVFNQITQAQLLPNLEELYYSNRTSRWVQGGTSGQGSQDPHLPFLDNFHLAPNLRRVCVDPHFLMHTPALAAKIDHYIIPLREFTIQLSATAADQRQDEHSQSVDKHLKAASLTVNMTSWTIQDLSRCDQLLTTFQTIPSLTSLYLSDGRNAVSEDMDGSIKFFLDAIKAPNLKKLSLEGEIDDTCMLHVGQFIRRSECEITDLTLSDRTSSVLALDATSLQDASLSSVRKLTLHYGKETSMKSGFLDPTQLVCHLDDFLPEELETWVLGRRIQIENKCLDQLRQRRDSLSIFRVDDPMLLKDIPQSVAEPKLKAASPSS